MTMRSLPFLLIVSGLLLLSLAGTVSAGEETVSISVDIPMKGYADETTNVSNVSTWDSMDIELDENFTFTFIADNLVNGTEYAFSYVIYTNRGDELSNVSHLFVANDTEEYSYNLEGQLGATSNWTTSATLEEVGGPNYSSGNCTEFIVKVSFVKNPNAKNDTWVLANFTSQEDFLPNGNMLFGGFYMAYCDNNPETITLGERVAILGLIIALPLLFLFSIYKMFKLSIQGGDGGAWAALFWLTMMVLPLWIFSYFWVQPF